ncbi:hypothetical protein [Geoalkalibacter sp.]|nr:hypothetical protein [Geoalkalibacter sp.]
MSSRGVADYLADILEAVEDIRSFVTDMDFVAFAADKKTVNRLNRWNAA